VSVDRSWVSLLAEGCAFSWEVQTLSGCVGSVHILPDCSLIRNVGIL
jgi:hypothetical protein